MTRKHFLSFPRPSNRLVRKNIHRWRFGMFKTLTDATYFLARQAVELREERVYSKVCNESWEAQLTRSDSLALTAGILLNKVLFFISKRSILQL